VRIYVDAVINHMCGSGGGAGTSSTCGTYYNANNRDFPGVPYSANHFNDGKCNGEINNYNDANQVRNCRLSGLLDLALDKSYVRGKVADYITVSSTWVIDLGGEAIKSSEFFGNGRVTEFKYGAKLGTVIRKWNGEKMAYLKIYKMAVGFMLAHPYGFTRVMSSYRWTRKFQNGKDVNDWIGPPNKNGVTKEVTINPDTTCGNDWVCEHRWRQIRALSKTLQTGLPAGTYCDVISGDKIDGKCTGTKVSVGSDGKAHFLLVTLLKTHLLQSMLNQN
ncbi:hypothetical protein U0070_010074, partial [Myodes glareolus]